MTAAEFLAQAAFWLLLAAAVRWASKLRVRRRPGPPPTRRPRLTLRQLVNLGQLHPTDLLIKDPPEPK